MCGKRLLRVPGSVLVLAGLFVAGHAAARTITVGSTGCQYIGLQYALDDLADEAGPHVIKLRTQTIAIPNGLVLDTTNTSYSFIGGHASCADATPTGSQRTVLDATGGDEGTAFAINGNGNSSRPAVVLSRLTIRGGSSETGIFSNPEGGGLEVRGRVIVQLNDATRVDSNASGKGGGVYLRGASASGLATLFIVGGSRISNNSAISTGGGVHCEEHGEVLHDNGEISFNSAERGGGAFVRGSCVYDAQVQAGSFSGITNNLSSLYGGGLLQEGTGPLSLRGAVDVPFWFINNIAATDGGAVFLINSTASRTTALLENVAMLGNRAGGNVGSAILVAGAIDATMRARSGSGHCALFGVGLGACLALVDNTLNGAAPLGGVVQLVESTGESENPTLTVRRTAFIDNHGVNLFSAWGPGRFDIENVLVSGTHLYAGYAGFPSALFRVEPDAYAYTPSPPPQRVAFSTIVATTRDGSASTVFDHGRSPLDITGSIVHTPGIPGRNVANVGAVTHNGCLLVHESSTFPSLPAPPLVAAPGLDWDLIPTQYSAAVDQCAVALAPAVDFHGAPRSIDQPGVPNGFGPVDLGAIERAADDIIFRNGFE